MDTRTLDCSSSGCWNFGLLSWVGRFGEFRTDKSQRLGRKAF